MVDLSTTEADEKARQLEEEMKKYKAMIVELAKKDPQPERPKFDTPRNPKYREDSEKPRRHSRERKSRDRKAKAGVGDDIDPRRRGGLTAVQQGYIFAPIMGKAAETVEEL